MAIHGPLLIGFARDLILDHLKSNINTEIANSDYYRADGINIEPINTEAFYISEKFIDLQPPAVYVIKDGPMTMDYSDSPNWLQGDSHFMVVVSAEDVGADILEKKCETFGQIVFKLLDQLDLVSSDNRLKIHLVIESVDFSDLMAQKHGQIGEIYRRDVILKVKAKHCEARLST